MSGCKAMPIHTGSVLSTVCIYCLPPPPPTGNASEADYFRNATLARQRAFHVFWNETDSLWKDWDLTTGMHLEGAFYASSLSPLAWTCGNGDIEQQEKVLSTLNSLGVLDYPGGVPSSLEHDSTQQWDFPNVWAPLEWLLVASWHDSPSAELREAARKVAQTWLTTTYLAWKNYNRTMFEKVCGSTGGGVGMLSPSNWYASMSFRQKLYFMLHYGVFSFAVQLHRGRAARGRGRV